MDHDIIALNQLAFRYAAAVDACDEAGFLAVFTPDARLRSYHPDSEAPFADLTGHAQLVAIPRAMRGMYRHTAHMMTNHLVTVNGDQATGTILCNARHLSADPAAPGALIVVIRYVDQYRRHADEWRIFDRQIRFLWSERHEVIDSGFARERGDGG